MQNRVYVDRIEGDRAVLVGGPDGRETITLPVAWLPDEAREGSALELSLTVTTEDSTRTKVQDLLDELFGASGS